VLTCLIGRHLGSPIGLSLDHFDLRDLAASLLHHLCQKYARVSHNLKPRLARSCLKNFLDPRKPLGTHYGAIWGLHAIGGAEVVRSLVVPNLKEFEAVLEEMLGDGNSNGNGIGSGVKKAEAEKVMQAILGVLGSLTEGQGGENDVEMVNGHGEAAVEEMRGRLVDKVGELVGTRIADSGHLQLAKAVLES
jgi:transcription initiation factor TFIID subunit 6